MAVHVYIHDAEFTNHRKEDERRRRGRDMPPGGTKGGTRPPFTMGDRARRDATSTAEEERKWRIGGEYPDGKKLAFTVLAFTHEAAKRKAEAKKGSARITSIVLQDRARRDDRPRMTYKLAMAAGQDAGNKNMRKNNRTSWNEDDFRVAAETTRKLMELV